MDCPKEKKKAKQKFNCSERRYSENSISPCVSCFLFTTRQETTRMATFDSVAQTVAFHYHNNNKKERKCRGTHEKNHFTTLPHFINSTRRDVIRAVAEARPTESRPHNRRHYICIKKRAIIIIFCTNMERLIDQQSRTRFLSAQYLRTCNNVQQYLRKKGTSSALSHKTH